MNSIKQEILEYIFDNKTKHYFMKLVSIYTHLCLSKSIWFLSNHTYNKRFYTIMLQVGCHINVFFLIADQVVEEVGIESH